jgi:hypothetical protein
LAAIAARLAVPSGFGQAKIVDDSQRVTRPEPVTRSGLERFPRKTPAVLELCGRCGFASAVYFELTAGPPAALK